MALHPQILFIVIHMTAVMTLAIFGNLFLVLIIVRGNAIIRRRISPVQLLLLHTCAADLLFALLSLGTEILIIITYPHFGGPGWLCQVVRYLQMFPLYASPFLLVAISADRFQLLLLHTCAADLLFALLSLGTEILIIITYPHFGGPGWLCQVVRYLQMFPLYASPFLLVAISADRFQLLLLHTCAADLLFALLSLGTEILIIITYPHFGGPGWLCQVVRYLQMFPLYASPFLLVAISADRFQLHAVKYIKILKRWVHTGLWWNP
ncbi:Vasopressin V1a receptor [Toxocara canis]|uniref:Vasopressin V1a receptor n=1 Tax=Toxocara canis TaxID=6265 RepID=A0A0B2VNK7_TOXCA|nr:Vasopressin V1a receptor [Toxocara canis]